MTTIMLTGKNGQLGWELQRTLQTLGKVIAFDHTSLDLTDDELLRKTIRSIKPDLIVNAAAYTTVDQAETDRDLAMAINAKAPETMAEEAKTLRCALIHYSTDYVFNGDKKDAYTEVDNTDPINVYGESKLLGEQAIQSIDLPFYIFRTSWVYTSRGHNFMLSMLRLMKERDTLNIVSDQFGTPTWSRTIAEATSQILSKTKDGNGLDHSAISDLRGIYHLTSNGRTNWCEFAETIYANKPDHLQILDEIKINGIPTMEYPTPAKRPLNSTLCTKKISNTFGITPPDWREALRLCLGQPDIT